MSITDYLNHLTCSLQRLFDVFKIVSREDWGAKPGRASKPLTQPVGCVVYHHTKGESCTSQRQCKEVVKKLQKKHMEEDNMDDIKYNFLIGGDGRVYEGRGWKVQADHIGDEEYDSQTIGIAFIGDYKMTIVENEMLEACRALLYYGVRWGYLEKGFEIHVHADFGEDIYCPGGGVLEEYFDDTSLLQPNEYWGQRTIFGKLWDRVKGME